MELNTEQLCCCARALRVAAEQYRRDADTIRESGSRGGSRSLGVKRLAQQFNKQADEADDLAEKIEEEIGL